MAGLPKWIIKKYGMTKKAWSVFRSGKSQAGGSAKKSGGHSGNNKGGKMAKAKAKAKAAGKKLRAAMATRPGKVLAFAGLAAAGGVGSSLVVNKTPMVKDWPVNGKAATQIGVGLAGIFFGRKRMKFLQALGVGATVFGVGGLVKSMLKLDPMAGAGSGTPQLSRAQMARITNGMGVPANVRMNRPANVRMSGSGSGWSQGWG